MKLYSHPLSGNSHRARALLGILGIEHEEVVVDLKTGAHKKPEFLKLNPKGQVPVLQDGNVLLRDSTAILVYLARRYAPDDRWLPSEPAIQAEVQQWLSTAVNEIQAGPFVVRLVKIAGAPLDYDAAVGKTRSLFDEVVEPHLADREWLAAAHPTIADLACYSYIARVTEGDFSLEPYSAIRAWLARVEGIKGFVPMVRIEDLHQGG